MTYDKGVEVRVGIGFDVHRFTPDRPLYLGGVRIPFPLGLEGHSDADVLIHALMDALLGAISAGDIGDHFPEKDERYKDAPSLSLLSEVVQILREKGYQVINLDVVAILEQPRLNLFKQEIQETLAHSLKVKPSQVSVKATTTEGLGLIDVKEGAAALAIALVEKVGTI